MAVLFIGATAVPVVRQIFGMISTNRLRGYEANFLPTTEQTPCGSKAVGKIVELETGRRESVAILYLFPGISALDAHPRMGFKYEESVLVMPPVDLQLDWLRRQGKEGLAEGYLAVEDARDVPLTDMKKLFFVSLRLPRDTQTTERLARALLRSFVFPDLPSSKPTEENERIRFAVEAAMPTRSEVAIPTYG